jgi:hypothetical protein
MDEDEAKRLVLDEFRIWCTAREIKLPALRSLAIEFYFDQLEADRRDLLDFPSEAGIFGEGRARRAARVRELRKWGRRATPQLASSCFAMLSLNTRCMRSYGQ